MIAKCAVGDCQKDARARGYCPMHYQRQRLHGSVHYVKQPETRAEMAERFWAKVQKGSGCWMWMAGKCTAGYGIFTSRRTDYKAHRLSYELTSGPIPDGMFIDHICHNPACVRPEHLRLATPKQNSENRGGSNRTSKSGIRGVALHKPSKRWRARVVHNYVPYTLGYFKSQEEAAAAVVAKRQELFTHTIERTAQ